MREKAIFLIISCIIFFSCSGNYDSNDNKPINIPFFKTKPNNEKKLVYLQGLKYEYYQGHFSLVEDMDVPVRTGISEGLDIGKRGLEHLGYKFYGFLKVPKMDDYTFHLSSDDGSQFFIDNQLLINNDSLHGLKTLSASIRLDEGYHPVKIFYFEGMRDEFLMLEWESSGILKCSIPNEFWYYKLD
jgi:hypothetical protein